MHINQVHMKHMLKCIYAPDKISNDEHTFFSFNFKLSAHYDSF